MGNPPVTGSFAAVVALIRGVVVAGFGRIEERVRDGARESLSLVLGDDAAIRALYAGVLARREALRERGAYREADDVLCETQRAAYARGERSLSLATNMYGWAILDVMSSNIAGGRAAQTARGATLEECLRYAVAATQRAGTTLCLHPATLVEHGACSWAEAVALAALCGATEEQQAWLLATPEREAQRAREAAERAARAAARQEFARRVEALFRGCEGVERTSSWAGCDVATVVLNLRGGRQASVQVRETGAVATLLHVDRARASSRALAAPVTTEGHPTLRGVQRLLLGAVRQGLSQA